MLWATQSNLVVVHVVGRSPHVVVPALWPPMGGLAGSTRRDLDARCWQSARFHHASNNHINPRLKNPTWSKGIGVF